MGRIIDKLRKDSTWMGVFLGLICPAVLFGIIELIIYIIETQSGKTNILDLQKVILLSVIPNLFILRYYLVKLKYDYTGKGIVLTTFLIGILFAILEFTL